MAKRAKPLLVLNFKTFSTSTGRNAVNLAKLAESFASHSHFAVVICPDAGDIEEVAKVCRRAKVYSQHVDAVELGQHTGSFPVPLAKKLGARGTILNHAEHKLKFSELSAAVKMCKKYKMKTLLCADSDAEARRIALLSPDFIAVEPPDLIGSGKSVSTMRPELVKKSIAAVKKINKKMLVLIGAGVTTAEDVRASLQLGAEGVLVASAFAASKNPRKWLESLKRI